MNDLPNTNHNKNRTDCDGGIMRHLIEALLRIEVSRANGKVQDNHNNKRDQEAPEHAAPVPPNWPETGRIDFNEVEMRYRLNLPLVLQGFDMHVRGGERQRQGKKGARHRRL